MKFDHYRILMTIIALSVIIATAYVIWVAKVNTPVLQIMSYSQYMPHDFWVTIPQFYSYQGFWIDVNELYSTIPTSQFS
jgi:hypothetical protein